MRIIAILLLAFSAGLQEPPALTESKIARAVESRRRIPWYTDHGQTKHWHACRTAPGGCYLHALSISRYIVAAAEVHGIDPYVLAAVGWRETKFHALALGNAGERGVFQIHPKTKKGFRFDKNKKECRQERGQCQNEIVDFAAKTLARYSDHCGGIDKGLSAWNTGKCESETGEAYALRVHQIAADFRETEEEV